MAERFTVERSERIAAAPAAVFARVGTLQGWDDWSPWADMDPEMEQVYSGEPGQVGSSYRWSGNRKVGEGQMTITEVEADERVVIDLRFVKPFKSENVTEILLASDGDSTEVTWRMTGPKTFMTKVMGVFGKTMDKMVGPDFERGLSTLKRVCET